MATWQHVLSAYSVSHFMLDVAQVVILFNIHNNLIGLYCVPLLQMREFRIRFGVTCN
jgi:hypothetical protein